MMKKIIIEIWMFKIKKYIKNYNLIFLYKLKVKKKLRNNKYKGFITI